MSNPFDDLESDDSDDGDNANESETDVTSTDEKGRSRDSLTSVDTTVTESNPEPTRESPEQTIENRDPADVGPAFDFSESRQKPMYPHDETWDEVEDQLGITVIPELRQMGIRDEEKREVHNALLKVAIEHSDEIADELAAERIRRSD